LHMLFTFIDFCCCRYFFSPSADTRDRHSFPTRRSSDLGVRRVGPDRWAAGGPRDVRDHPARRSGGHRVLAARPCALGAVRLAHRSEEHTSELQSRENLVCRLLLEKKKKYRKKNHVGYNT